jgi:hypothetical protein
MRLSVMEKIIYLLVLPFIICLGAFTAAQSGNAVELPMTFHGRVTAVEVSINGQGPFLFALDTGAQGAARIDVSLIRRLGLKPSGSRRESDPSGRNPQTFETFTLDSLSVGRLEFKKVEALARDFNAAPRAPRMPPAAVPPNAVPEMPRERPETPKIDGILGFDLFADYLLTLDYPAKKVIVKKGALPAANNRDILDFDDSRGVAVIEISVGGQKVRAHLDSGNMVGGFVLPTAVVERCVLASEPVVAGRARSASGEIEIKQVRLKDSIRFGSFEFVEPTVTYPSLSDANIGSHILSQFAVTFDRKNRRVRFEKR